MYINPKYRRGYGVPYFMFMENFFLHWFRNGEISKGVVKLCVFSFSDDGFDWQVKNSKEKKIVTDSCDKILEGANLKQIITLNA